MQEYQRLCTSSVELIRAREKVGKLEEQLKKRDEIIMKLKDKLKEKLTQANLPSVNLKLTSKV